ncbi:MAG: family 20 glycosylhydrolase [Eubacteriales bacterium]|nr:family 20 glycosylhydrolase [Eubacteriales bacterium]MDD4474226.1 family 20 glycosylhydrolase [Eubacteriales bacterium]
MKKTSIIILASFLFCMFTVSGLSAASPNLSGLKNLSPSISQNDKALIMPESPLKGYNIELFGSDNLQTIDLKGNVYKPLKDTKVNLIYKAVSTKNPDDVIIGDFNVSIVIKGLYGKEPEDNPEPDVLPSLREWKGGQGEFHINQTSHIVINTHDLFDIAKMLQSNIKSMLGLELEIVSKEPGENDIFLCLTDENPELGNEGYYLEINDYVSVKSNSFIGVHYGGISLTQIAFQSTDKSSLPRGIARDYPKYEVRSAHLDVGRAWIDIDYLTEIMKYCAWYKINDLHLHINDWGGNQYQAYRLESKFDGLAADDGYYTKDEYREFQNISLKFGINIVTEIDTPAHATSFQRVMPEIPTLSWSYLDITSPKIVEFVKQLLDEYIDGDDPVFASGYVDIGTDEYPREYGEYMRIYISELLEHIRNRGFTPRLWAKFGSEDSYNGETSVKGYAQALYAVPLMQDSQTLIDYGYDIINAIQMLYIVPGGPHGYADYMDVQYLYDHWEANYYAYDGSSKALLGHPQLSGAMFCLWNDLYTTNSGFSVFDIFDRFKGGVSLISEKTWYGEKKSNQNSDDFMKKIEALGNTVPTVNPLRSIKAKSDVIVDIDFENATTDKSGNSYIPKLNNVLLETKEDNTYVKLDDMGFISLPFDSVGFPYTASFDLFLSSNPDADSILFSGRDGTFYLNIDNTEKVGFRRGNYIFIYDFKIATDEWYNIKLICDGKQTILVVNDKYKYDAINQKYSDQMHSSTFVLPTEQIGKGVLGAIDNIKILNRVIDISLFKNKQVVAVAQTKESAIYKSNKNTIKVDEQFDTSNIILFIVLILIFTSILIGLLRNKKEKRNIVNA